MYVTLSLKIRYDTGVVLVVYSVSLFPTFVLSGMYCGNDYRVTSLNTKDTRRDSKRLNLRRQGVFLCTSGRSHVNLILNTCDIPG